jgi:hypothetical protein
MAELQNLKKDPQDPPLIAIFPSGIPTVIANQTDFPFQFMTPSDQKKYTGSYIYGESENLRFVGSTHEQFNLSKNNFNYSIGYFDPKKPARVKLVQANGIFTVKQIAVGDVNGPDDGSIRELEYNAARRDVTELFGARKNKRQLRSQEAGRVNIEADQAALQALDTQLTAIDADGTFEETLSASEQNLLATHKKSLPPFNLEATNVENVYPFEGMLPKFFWRDLDGPKLLALRLDTVSSAPKKTKKDKKGQKRMKDDDDDDDDNDSSSGSESSDSESSSDEELFDDEAKDETKSTLHLSSADQAIVDSLPSFIRTRRDLIAAQIRQAQGIGGNAVNKTLLLNKINQLAYFLLLHRLYLLRRATPRVGFNTKLSDVLGIHQQIGLHLKSTLFRGNLEFTNESTTRILCYLLVMSLLCADSFTVDGPYVAEIAQSLKLPAVELSKVYTRLGANVNASGRAKLTAPLKLPGFKKDSGNKRK